MLIIYTWKYICHLHFFILFASIRKQMNKFAVMVGHRRITTRIIFLKAPWWTFGNILLFVGWRMRKKHRFVGNKNFKRILKRGKFPSIPILSLFVKYSRFFFWAHVLQQNSEKLMTKRSKIRQLWTSYSETPHVVTSFVLGSCLFKKKNHTFEISF